jgi:hypothetical protein
VGALLLFFAVLSFAGCGVSFSAEEEQSEIFTDLSISGDFTPRGQLILALRYQQRYPVEIQVVCEVLEDRSGPREERLLTRVLEQQLLPTGSLSMGEGTAVPLETITPVPGTFEQPFNGPDQPGRYEVECLTPADDNNDIEESFTIEPIPTVTPVDTPPNEG